MLSPGATPHPPHAHVEEEILIVLDGEAELLIADGPDPESARPHPAGPGMFVYYPAYRHHTIRNAGSGPLTYLMFKWRGTPVATESALPTHIVDPEDHAPGKSRKGAKPIRRSLLLEGPTNFLDNLHVHCSEVEPGGGYEPHRDAYDVAIVVLSGTIETDDGRLDPFGVLYHAAGEPHGLRARGTAPARYLVFEFHGDAAAREKIPGAPREVSPRFEKVRSILARHPTIRKLIPPGAKTLARKVLMRLDRG